MKLRGKMKELYDSFVEVEDAIFGMDVEIEFEINVIDDIYLDDNVSNLQTFIRQKNLVNVLPLHDVTLNASNLHVHSDFKLTSFTLTAFAGNLQE